MYRIAHIPVVAFGPLLVLWLSGDAFGNATVSEPIFVPKSKDSPEADGYLLTVSTDFSTRSSTVNVFNATKLSAGPIGRAHLSHYVPVGFHGTWRPAS